QPELRTISEGQQAIFDRGTNVGLLAQQKFPGGIDASEGHDWPNFECADTTKYLIGVGQKIIYEATFVYNKVLVAVDILVMNEHGTWDAYEVKSTNGVKDPHMVDCAIQYYIMEGCGVTLRTMSVMHFNREYVRHGELDIERLFVATDITRQVRAMQVDKPSIIAELEAVQQRATCPDIEIGIHCNSPYDCDFRSHCWKRVPDYSVFDLTRGTDRGWELYQKGIMKISDIPMEYPLSDSQRIQHKAEVTGEPYIYKEGIDRFLGDLEYPIYHFDFETMMSAVPLFDNSRTYQQIPFQYSVHIQSAVGEETGHLEYLTPTESGISGSDPRGELINNMLEDLGTSGTILAYHSSFEEGRIKELVRDFPQYAVPLLALNERILDLELPFRKKYYYTRAMQGRSSIKKVLPALVPELSYSDLTIQEGVTASTIFASMHKGEYEGNYAATHQHLLEYCRLDTWAMLKLLEVLYKV
ncbi:DUF2779 domain-containing protein, partial [Bacteroidia bacterium]|nr:DUF2779 domain-containing protein [Bacteroidia bacterium]